MSKEYIHDWQEAKKVIYVKLKQMIWNTYNKTIKNNRTSHF